MGTRSYFFDSVMDDRPYDSFDFSIKNRHLASNGYTLLDRDELEVLAVSATMNVEMQTGSAWLQGRFIDVFEPQVRTVPDNNSGLPRIDRVVIQMNATIGVRDILIYIKEGTPAASPEPPALTQTEEVWELSMAQVFVADGAIAIEQADITDERADVQGVCGRSRQPSALGSRASHISVAASDSSSVVKAMADFVATGVNDQVIINMAINALPLNGGSVRLLAGTYNISDSIVVGSLANPGIALYGEGLTSNIRLMGGVSHNNPLILIDGHDAVIRDMTINGNRANVTGANIGIFQQRRRASITGLRVVSCTSNGIRVTERDNRISDCYIAFHDFGVVMTGAACFRSTLSECQVITCDLDGISIGDGAGFNVIQNNIIQENGQRGIRILTGNNNTIQSNVISRNSTSSNLGFDNIDISSGANRTSIVGNTIERGPSGNRARYGINLGAITVTETFIDGNNNVSGGMTRNFFSAGDNTRTGQEGWLELQHFEDGNTGTNINFLFTANERFDQYKVVGQIGNLDTTNNMVIAARINGFSGSSDYRSVMYSTTDNIFLDTNSVIDLGRIPPLRTADFAFGFTGKHAYDASEQTLRSWNLGAANGTGLQPMSLEGWLTTNQAQLQSLQILAIRNSRASMTVYGRNIRR